MQRLQAQGSASALTAELAALKMENARLRGATDCHSSERALLEVTPRALAVRSVASLRVTVAPALCRKTLAFKLKSTAAVRRLLTRAHRWSGYESCTPHLSAIERSTTRTYAVVLPN